jgi:prepilin-type N-terminal cleavage/methylation domain-containing protein
MNKISRVDWGFTLVEMLTVVGITGILAAIAVPSLISQQKPMKLAVSQVNTMLKTVNLVARANSGNPYRIRPVFVSGQYHFRVETRRNGTCENSLTAPGWLGDNNKFVYLPAGIAIRNSDDSANFDSLSATDKEAMTICFDGRGTESNGGRTFNLRDNYQSSSTYRSEIKVSAVGDVSYKNFNINNNPL